MKDEFKQIAAYEGQEIASAAKRILNDPEFSQWLKKTTGREISAWQKHLFVSSLRVVFNPLKKIDYLLVLPFLEKLISRSTNGIHLHCDNKPEGSRFFMTNHRDIILDAAFLSMELRQRYDIRPYLGVGNNLFGRKWIEDLMRMLRCFAVIRNGGPREIMQNARTLSGYIADRQKAGYSFWMAQREGRAKDSNDTTQPSVLKMLTLAHEDNLIDALKALNITPVSITYEYDPCDYLKAREFQLKRDKPDWKKSPKDDMLSMQTGLRGKKGEVHLVMTPCINDELEQLRHKRNDDGEQLSRNDILREAALIIDRHIHAGYHLAWTNLAARDILEGRENELFERYLEERISKIQMPEGVEKDVPFLRSRLLEMYANPAINHLHAKAKY